jgi:hypothetical protein
VHFVAVYYKINNNNNNTTTTTMTMTLVAIATRWVKEGEKKQIVSK